ncbi:MAG: class I SAM-dependent methyltransferase [Candidatus Lokiarchaeia archaeon]
MNSKNYFDEVANEWDRMRQSFFSDAVRQKAYSVAGVKEGETAADIGAGTGFITEGLVARGLRVFAVDQSEEMLVVMKKKFSKFEGIEYRLVKEVSLPIPDESVDYAFANMYLHHVESPPDAIREMVRILKSGGKLVITDLDEHGFEFLRVEHHDRWMGFKRDDIKQWFTESGLKKVVVDCVGEDCCAESSCGSDYASISIFVASGEK